MYVSLMYSYIPLTFSFYQEAVIIVDCGLSFEWNFVFEEGKLSSYGEWKCFIESRLGRSSEFKT